MTISTTATSVQYVRNGTTTQWSYPNKIFAAADLVVNDLDTSVPPIAKLLVLNTDYTVQNVDVDTGATVTTTVAGIAGHTLDIRSNIAQNQLTSIKNQGSYLPELHEEFFDKATREIQDLRRLAYTFGIHGPDIEATPWAALPIAANRANNYLGFDGNGLPKLYTGPSPFTNPTLGPGDIRLYGAVSGSDCTTAVASAAGANPQVIFPPGVWPMASTPTVPPGVFLQAMPGSSFSGAGVPALGLNNIDFNQWNVNESIAATGPVFVDVLRINHSYGGSTMQGGRNSFEVQCGLTAPSSPVNANRNYVAGNFQTNISANDNGTSPGSNITALGAAFGIGVNCVLYNGATSFLNASAAEFNLACQTGSSVYYRSIIQLCELATSAVQGQGFDVMLSLSNQGGVGFQVGIGFNAANTSHPVTATGTLIQTQGSHTVVNGVDLSSYTFTGRSFNATGFAVQGNGSQIDLGLVGSANTYQMFFHTGAVAPPNYDSRIVTSGGTGVNGGGSMVLNSAQLGFFNAGAGAAKAVGYGTPTGNAYQASFAAGAITLPNLAAAVAQLIIDLKSYTLIGA